MSASFQLSKLDNFIETRLENHKYFLERIKNTRVLPQKGGREGSKR